jgi:outer membrane protein OmpA-like peptidoglycan-associated protein
MKKYCISLLAFCLLLSSTGRPQEKDIRLINKDSLFIHFDFGRSSLRPDARAAIDSEFFSRIVAIDAPLAVIVKIDMMGYCDSVGGNAYNDYLSRQRVVAIYDYLKSRGLPDTLFGKMKGEGKRLPLNDNGDENKRSLNRRVVMILYRTPFTPAFFKVSTPNEPTGNISAGDSKRSPTTPSLTLAEFFRDSARAGKSFVLRNLNFEVGRHVLLPYSDTVLKELLKIMLDSPRLKIEIRGHVCCIPPTLDGLDADTRTEDLSIRRARFVYEYLRQRGVKASRMSYHGFGASQKLYPEERNEQEEEMNRRVEIKRKNPQD